MVLPVRQGSCRRWPVAGTSKSPSLSMRGLAARDNGSALIVGHADVRAPAGRCWRKLVTHVVLTVRCANVRKIIAEKLPRTAESREGHVPSRLRRQHTASAALSVPPHLLRDEIWRIVEQARATAMTRHPCRVPLPCQIAESRAESSTHPRPPTLTGSTNTRSRPVRPRLPRHPTPRIGQTGRGLRVDSDKINITNVMCQF